MRYLSLNRAAFNIIIGIVIVAFTVIGASFLLLSSELKSQKENELSIAGVAVGNAVDNYFNTIGESLKRIAESDAVEKFNLAYNKPALEAFLQPYIDIFDTIEVTGSNGETVRTGEKFVLDHIHQHETLISDSQASDTPTLTLQRYGPGNEHLYLLVFSYTHVNYFDQVVARVSATVQPSKLAAKIETFSREAHVLVTIADSTGHTLLDQINASEHKQTSALTRPITNTTMPLDNTKLGFIPDARFLGCDCVANALSSKPYELTVYTAYHRRDYLSSVRTLQLIVFIGGMSVTLALIVIALLFREANSRWKERQVAEEKTQFKSEFMAKISHELRTPLNAIIGYTELLLEDIDDQDAAESRRDLRKVHSAGEHLLHLINQLLDLQKIEAGKMDVNIETFYLDALLHDVVDAVTPLSNKANHSLRLSISDSAQSITSDPTKVRQIILNLLSNAIKFSDNGSSIHLRLNTFEETGTKWYRIDVEDNGPGIAEQDLTKLFQDFSQLQTTSRHNNLGSGLGLAINKRLCELLGGHIKIQSQLGAGTNITVALPAQLNVKKEVA